MGPSPPGCAPGASTTDFVAARGLNAAALEEALARLPARGLCRLGFVPGRVIFGAV